MNRIKKLVNQLKYKRLNNVNKCYTLCSKPMEMENGMRTGGILLIKAHSSYKCMPVFKTINIAREYQKLYSNLPTEIIQIEKIPDEYY